LLAVAFDAQLATAKAGSVTPSPDAVGISLAWPILFLVESEMARKQVTSVENHMADRADVLLGFAVVVSVSS
jgi:hypothetical protein